MQEVLLLSSDVSAEVTEVVRLAAEEPLTDDEAERLFTKILTIVKGGLDRGIDAKGKAAIAKEVKSIVQKLVVHPRGRRTNATHSAPTFPRVDATQTAAAPRRSPETRRRHLELIDHGGLKPRPVTPTPWFRNAPVELREGYVSTTDLKLWPENHRLELQLNQFRAREGREPTNDELLEILQGTRKTSARGARVVDAFQIRPLALSIAEKGVERAPIIDWWGVPHDGNRRIAACHYILKSNEFNTQQKERASKIRVWQAGENTTSDQFDAIVVSLNFENDHKLPWPEYVKARRVSAYADELVALQTDIGDPESDLEVRRKVAKRFSISLQDVTRYIRMVRWAEMFTEYHIENRNIDPATVESRTDEIFQWFYEIDAGKGDAKLSPKLLVDDTLKEIVFDLMFDKKLEIGAQVRDLHKILGNEDAFDLLKRAHAEPGTLAARDLIADAISIARSKNLVIKKAGFTNSVRRLLATLDDVTPSMWKSVTDSDLLLNMRRVLSAAHGAVHAELEARGLSSPTTTDAS